MYGFGVLNHGPAEVSRALHGEPKKKTKKTKKKKKNERPVEAEKIEMERAGESVSSCQNKFTGNGD